MPSIAVVGLGNRLMRDDGIGARALDALARRYVVPPTVRLIDSAAPMAGLLAELDGIDHLIVIDAVRGGGEPGAVYRIGRLGRAEFERPASTNRPACSSHGAGLADLTALLSALGRCPEIRIVGVEADELSDAGLELSEPVAAALPRVADAVAGELRRLGVVIEERKVYRHA
ncbi:MAG: hydrogenase maturation protease [Nitrospirae bacterium]|nr:hydrogenase maturation protease [Nitrospirota bacterium]